MAASESLDELVRQLHSAGLAPDARSLADALWLARWATPSAGAPPVPGRRSPGSRWQPPAPPRDVPPPASAEPEDEPGAPPRQVLRPVDPAPYSLPILPELHRALRPLQRHRGTARPSGLALDEQATAELRARTGLLTPVFSASRRRRTATMQLLLDSSSSMVVWERTAQELFQALAQCGAFHDVRLHRMYTTEDGGRAPGPGRPGARPWGPAQHLCDPTGATFTLVLSDCAGPAWRSGGAQRLLHDLARVGAPLAVLQPLPQRLWSRTVLDPRPGTLRLRPGPGLRLDFRPDAGPSTEHPGPAVPVLPLSAEALGMWANLLTGTTPLQIRGAAARVGPGRPAAGPARAAWRARSAAERVGRFRAGASPAAQRLAVLLSAAPLVLPVMQVVQRRLLPDTGPGELAELLLSGLLSHSNPEGTQDTAWYDFSPGVREKLLQLLDRERAVSVLRVCSDYVEQNLGRGVRNFPELAMEHLATGDATAGATVPRAGEEDVPAPFAAVAAGVVRRFTTPVVPEPPEPYDRRLARARALLNAVEGDGGAQALGRLAVAVELLRGLTGPESGPAPHAEDEPSAEQRAEAATALGRALLLLWQRQPAPGLLEEAERAASIAVAAVAGRPPEAWHGRAGHLRGRVWRALAAEDGRTAEHAEARGRLLVRAERELDQAARLLGLETDDGLDAELERVDILLELWELDQQDLHPLYEARGGLRTLAAARTFWASRMTDVHRRLGQVLLALAGAVSGAEQAQEYAADAVAELTRALDLLIAEPDGPGRADALLRELAEARARCAR
ncbi:SAV_2336 N-terminal domain-related protein [Streptomyces puniciscabiei]